MLAGLLALLAMMSLLVVGGASPASASEAPSGVLQIETGGGHSCAVLGDGTVRCWGKNNLGQLGDGTTSQRTTPVTVSGISDAIQVTTGADHTCALLAGGGVKCWGDNTFGQVGNGTGGATNALSPVTVEEITTATQLSAGGDQTCAVLSNGSVRCWGDNTFGQLGNGSVLTSSRTPQVVTSVSNATQAAVGTNHSCALLGNGTVACWGRNLFGQLGEGSTASSPTRVFVDGLTNANDLSSGHQHSCAAQTGEIRCWGRNNAGQLGNNSLTDSSSPVSVSGIFKGSAVSAGSDHSCAIEGAGGIKCWGANVPGQLGNGTNVSFATPVVPIGIRKISQVSTGDKRSCAIEKHGSLTCWGKNAKGGLGSGSLTNSPIPVGVVGLRTYGNCRAAPVDPAYGVSDGTNASVYRLYCAYFLRYPDVPGFEYWLGRYSAGAVGLDDVSDLFAVSPEFIQSYGNLSNEDFITQVYRNVMERAPDTEGYDYWLNKVVIGEITRGDVMLYFAEALEFRNKTGT